MVPPKKLPTSKRPSPQPRVTNLVWHVEQARARLPDPTPPRGPLDGLIERGMTIQQDLDRMHREDNALIARERRRLDAELSREMARNPELRAEYNRRYRGGFE
jgi:hypothetical protein